MRITVDVNNNCGSAVPEAKTIVDRQYKMEAENLRCKVKKFGLANSDCAIQNKEGFADYRLVIHIT